MNFKGEYRDILWTIPKTVPLMDSGWKSNRITEDYALFLARLMKKDFNCPTAIDYIAVGSGSTDFGAFKQKVKTYFDRRNGGFLGPHTIGSDWVWAKEILPGDLKYIDHLDIETSTVTQRLKIDINFTQAEPAQGTYIFKEFGLLGIDKDPQGKSIIDRVYFINYVAHGQVTKDNTMQFSRTVKLLFPMTVVETK